MDRSNHEPKISTIMVQLLQSVRATRPIPQIPDIWESPKSHPQLPIDSLQPWSKDSFNFFIFIYLVDALWGQHLYMYKVCTLQKQPYQLHPLAALVAHQDLPWVN